MPGQYLSASRRQFLLQSCGAAVWASRGPAIVWEVSTGRECMQFRLRTEEDCDDHGVAFSPDGGKLAILSADELRIWDIASFQVLVSFDASGWLEPNP